jgi:hypothetical protein
MPKEFTLPKSVNRFEQRPKIQLRKGSPFKTMQLGVILYSLVQSRLHAGFLVNIIDHGEIEKGAGADKSRPAKRAAKSASSTIARP